MGTLIIWAEVLDNIFAETVKGIDIVLQTPTQAFTYTVVDGKAQYRYVPANPTGASHDPHDRLLTHATVALWIQWSWGFA